MLRSIAAVAALALLLPARAEALAIAYDLNGHGHATSAGPSTPPGFPPPGSTFGAGSAVSLQLDRNRDGVSGDVSVEALVKTVAEQRQGISVLSVEDTYFVVGATGTLSGHEIFWDPGHTTVTHTRVNYCIGPYCNFYGIPGSAQGPTLDASYSLNPDVDLGYWVLSDDLTRIVGSTIAVFSTGAPDAGGIDGQPLEWLRFGDFVVERPQVPEPSAVPWVGAALVLAALGARQRAMTDR